MATKYIVSKKPIDDIDVGDLFFCGGNLDRSVSFKNLYRVVGVETTTIREKTTLGKIGTRSSFKKCKVVNIFHSHAYENAPDMYIELDKSWKIAEEVNTQPRYMKFPIGGVVIESPHHDGIGFRMVRTECGFELQAQKSGGHTWVCVNGCSRDASFAKDWAKFLHTMANEIEHFCDEE